jgi:hypothetical protein
MGSRARYVSDAEDSGRWDGFEFRNGDIVISTRSKHGTTWMQMICALLVHRTASLPAPLTTLSPWLDWRFIPIGEVLAGLAAQTHRRIVKTHTPLDGIPIDPRATYIVVARDPRDALISLHHQSINIDLERLRELGAEGVDDAKRAVRRSVRENLVRFFEYDGSPAENLDSLAGVMHHLGDAWRREERNVLLVHYADLARDLEGEMRRIARAIGAEVGSGEWPGLVRAATFDEMRARAEDLVPDGRLGIFVDPRAFFRSGGSAEWRALLDERERARYDERVRALAPPDLARWLHR